MPSEALFSPHRHAYVLELLLHHFLGLRVKERVNLELQILVLLGLLGASHHLVVGPLHQ